ncbi:MAG: InlB B-repeat-containing protein [Clostridia bacterium]|nr:InlB B-repeat-containing protein [Clostridia bacterium]
MNKLFNKKFLILLLLACTLVCAMLVCACSQESGSKTLYFELNGDTYSYCDVLDDGSFTMPTDPVKEDHKFRGWYYLNSKNDKVFIDKNYDFSGIQLPLVLYAEFYFVDKIEINYELGGGTNADNPATCYEDENYVLNSPTRRTLLSTEYDCVNDTIVKTETYSEYEFLGWYVDNLYQTQVSSLNYSLGDVTLYAQWSANPTIKDIIDTGDYFIDENSLYFGSHPQTLVENELIINDLNFGCGNLPTQDSLNGWTSFGYYLSGAKSDYTFYKDVTLNGVKYRGVCFTEYRPVNNTYSNNNAVCQYNSGYEKMQVYFFRFDPIKWDILKIEGSQALVYSDLILDSVCWQEDESAFSDLKTYPNNYELSTIRKYLNDGFLDIAFNDTQAQKIITSINDNSEKTSFTNPNPYLCNDTEDKVFLLSYKDLVNESYRFNKVYSIYDPARRKSGTDYANCLGLRYGTGEYDSYASYWLRTPFYSSENVSHLVLPTGYSTAVFAVTECCVGLVPALNINLN